MTSQRQQECRSHVVTETGGGLPVFLPIKRNHIPPDWNKVILCSTAGSPAAVARNIFREESDGMPVGGLFRRKRADDNKSAASAPNGGGSVGDHLVDLHAAR